MNSESCAITMPSVKWWQDRGFRVRSRGNIPPCIFSLFFGGSNPLRRISKGARIAPGNLRIRYATPPKQGRATRRLLLKRDGYAVDLEQVLQAAAKAGTLIEINAQPQRLDLDWVHCKRAKALGVKIVINPDAHSTDELALYRFGVDVARRGWLTKADVANTRTWKQLDKLRKKRP